MEAPAAKTPAAVQQAATVRRRREFWIAISLLALALIGAGTYLTLALLDLQRANTRIEQQNDQINRQNDEIEKKDELIEKKETFGAAMGQLLDTAARFDGVLIPTVVPSEKFQTIADRAYAHRRDAFALDEDISAAIETTVELESTLAAATLQSTTNSTSTQYETVIDQLGGGYVSSVLENADAYCAMDVIACVGSEDPLVVHFDLGDNSLPYMTDELRTGAAYHEFAHVLQFTHPEITETAVAAFGGDVETMADCYALTYLPGWKLDHRIYINRYEYWDVNLGYGLTCDEGQRQVIRDWFGQMGYASEPISQGD